MSKFRMDRLKEIRTGQGLSVTELAKLAGLSRVYVYQLEGGQRDNPSHDTLAKLAQALEVPVASLLS